MTKTEIFEKLKEIVFDIIDEVELDENTPIVEKQLMDSLELINYLTQIEEHFEVEITMEELADKKLGLMKNMVDYLSERI